MLTRQLLFQCSERSGNKKVKSKVASIICACFLLCWKMGFSPQVGTHILDHFKATVLLQSGSLAHSDCMMLTPVFFICRPGFLCRNLCIGMMVLSHFQKASFKIHFLKYDPFLFNAKAVVYGFLLFLQTSVSDWFSSCFFLCHFHFSPFVSYACKRLMCGEKDEVLECITWWRNVVWLNKERSE